MKYFAKIDSVNKKLSDIAEINLGHTFRGAIQADEAGNTIILQAKNINQSGELTYNFVKTTLEKFPIRSLVQHEDLVLSNRGTFRSAIYRGNNTNLIASSSVYLIRVKKDERVKVLPEYLTIYLNSKIGQARLESITSGTLIQSLPKGVLVNLKIPLPSLKNQAIIINLHQNHRARSALYEKKAKIHKNLADALISKLITA